MKKCYSCETEINETFNFCPNCGVNLSEKKCSNCGTLNVVSSKFCKECGLNLIENKSQKKDAKKINVAINPPPVSDQGITIEFKHSTSMNFEFALEEAKKLDSYEEFGNGKKTIHRVNVQEVEIENLGDLVDNMKGWRNRTVYLKGEKVTWDSVFRYKWCYNRQLSSFKPDLYCFGYDSEYQFNIWGCIQSNLSFTKNSKLFTLGKWINKDGDWEFDKDRIRHQLEQGIFDYRFCPSMNLNLMKDILEVFPKVVNPKKDKNWEFVENWNSEEGLLITKTEYGFREKKYMNGAQPKNMKKFIKEIEKKISYKLPIKK